MSITKLGRMRAIALFLISSLLSTQLAIARDCYIEGIPKSEETGCTKEDDTCNDTTTVWDYFTGCSFAAMDGDCNCDLRYGDIGDTFPCETDYDYDQLLLCFLEYAIGSGTCIGCLVCIVLAAGGSFPTGGASLAIALAVCGGSCSTCIGIIIIEANDANDPDCSGGGIIDSCDKDENDKEDEYGSGASIIWHDDCTP